MSEPRRKEHLPKYKGSGLEKSAANALKAEMSAAAKILDSGGSHSKTRRQAFIDLGPDAKRGRAKAAALLLEGIRKGFRLPKGEHEGMLRAYKEAGELRDDEYEESQESYRKYSAMEAEGKPFAGFAGRNNQDIIKRKYKAKAVSGPSAPQRFLYKKVKDPVKK